MPTLEELFAQVDAQREEIIALEQALVRIPSVNTGFMPTGDETPVCEYIRDWLAEDGIESEILGRTPERGNILARIEGSNSDAGLMFMSHTDVVPVEEEEKWRFPPFSATIADGRIYGRGASDCKGLLTAQLYAMRLLIRNGIQLEDSLIFCSGADEEHGGRYGFGWLAENHPDKIRAPFAVNEGGGTPIDSPSGLTYLLGTGEKGRLQVEIEVKGVSSHASVPWQGTNALYTLQRVLQRIEAYEPERDTSTSLFDHLSVFAIEHKPSAANVDEIIAEIEPENPRFASMMRALSRMTLTPTMISGGIKSNSVPRPSASPATSARSPTRATTTCESSWIPSSKASPTPPTKSTTWPCPTHPHSTPTWAGASREPQQPRSALTTSSGFPPSAPASPTPASPDPSAR